MLNATQFLAKSSLYGWAIEKIIRKTALAIFFVLAILQTLAIAQPLVVVPQTQYDFGTVPEGKVVTHAFVVENRGDSPLQIQSAKATCSCTTVEHEAFIKPGKTGQLKIAFDSRGYGGRQAKVNIRVQTNSPARPAFNLQLAGTVDRLLTMTPPIVKLQGSPGQRMEQTVIITPDPKYPFEVLGAKAQKGEHLTFQWQKIEQDNRPAYQVNIAFSADRKRLYFDKVLLRTTSDLKPEIKIAVFAKVTG